MSAEFDLAPLLGLPLTEARQRLEATHVAVEVRESAPPRLRHPIEGPWRVARARWVAGIAELVVVRSVPLPC